jgi:hypothetical protein
MACDAYGLHHSADKLECDSPLVTSFLSCCRCQNAPAVAIAVVANYAVLLAVHAVLDPAVMAYDAYGLHHSADKPEREGHAISMMGREDARAAIAGLHKKFNDRNKLVAFAVNPDQRVSTLCL